MRFVYLGLFAAWTMSAQSFSAQVPRAISRLVPRPYNLDAPAHARAKKEVLRLIDQCGMGVFKGAIDEHGNRLMNRCSYEVELDDLFFTPMSRKTGLLPDPEWPYQEEQTWYLANEVEIPESYDIRDFMKNGQPELRTQQCGDCWAWATHHGLELARAVFDQKVYDHAVQTVVSCSGHGSCGGGYMSAPTWLINRGLPYEQDNPYQGGVTGKCKFSSQQLQEGWEGAIHDAPNIGSSLDYSRYFQPSGYREGQKVKNIMNAILQAKSPAVVTVDAYNISGDGIYNSCSAINSGGNHMVTIVGWDSDNGKRNAHVWNSWGKSHGKDGVSRIQWECGDGKLNRGLGVSARIIHYVIPCETPSLRSLQNRYETRDGAGIKLGKKMANVKCQWLPAEGLSDANACETTATPKISTEYHLQVTSACGTTSAMTVVDVLTGTGEPSTKLMTPFGEIERP